MYKSIEKIREEIREITKYTVWIRNEKIEDELKARGVRFSKSMEYLIDTCEAVPSYSFRIRSSIFEKILESFDENDVVYWTKVFG